jgi:hypothetical protein
MRIPSNSRGAGLLQKEDSLRGADELLRRTKSLDAHGTDDSSSHDDITPIDSDSDDDEHTGGEESPIGSSSASSSPKLSGGGDGDGSKGGALAEEVTNVLLSLSLGRHADAFATRAPEGKALDLATFAQLEEEDLKRLNLPPGARRKLRAWQKKYLAQQASPAAMRRSAGDEPNRGSPVRAKGAAAVVNIHLKDSPPPELAKEGGKRSLALGISQLKKKFSNIGPADATASSGDGEDDKRSIFARKCVGALHIPPPGGGVGTQVS